MISFSLKNVFFAVLIGASLGLNLAMTLWVSWRLGPEGFSRTQAAYAIGALCEHIQKTEPKFKCPIIIPEDNHHVQVGVTR